MYELITLITLDSGLGLGLVMHEANNEGNESGCRTFVLILLGVIIVTFKIIFFTLFF